MKTFIVRSEQKYIGYQICMYTVQAKTAEEAKQLVLDRSDSVEEFDTYDTGTDDYEFINSDNWEVMENK